MFRTRGFIFRKTVVRASMVWFVYMQKFGAAYTNFLDHSTEHTLPPTRLLIPMACKKLYRTCTYDRLAKDEPSGLKHVEDTVKTKVLV
jgi:hypothetical protein